jgi:secreted Zn-dependent insulinase-like peptidase
LQDGGFGLPKTNSFFSICSPIAQSGVRNAVLLEWYDDLNEPAYSAQLAGLNFFIDAHARGFSVRISGYDDKQVVLLQSIIESPLWEQWPARSRSERRNMTHLLPGADTQRPRICTSQHRYGANMELIIKCE